MDVAPFSWFTAGEGIYTLTASLNVPTPTSSNLSTNHFNPSAPLPTPIPPPAPLEPSPPLHTTRLCTVSVWFPGRGKGAREPGADSLSSPTPMSPSSHSPIGLPLQPEDDFLGSPLSTHPTPILGASPLIKRKPLSSSFSIPTLSSLSSTGSRPIRQFRGTSSSFVRSWEGLPLSQVQIKSLGEDKGSAGGREVLCCFYTSGKSVVWCEIGPGRSKDAICRVSLGAPPTCVDVNPWTASHQQLDVLIGFASGDIFWFDPLLARYTRLNKSGVITTSPITSIKWLPPSSPLSSPEGASADFMTSHADGTIIMWNKDREDWSGFVPRPSYPIRSGSGKENVDVDGEEGREKVGGAEGRDMDMVVTRPAAVDKKGVGTSKFNPVRHWRVSSKALAGFAFSPDQQFCAVIGQDGCLRVIDATTETLLDTFAGYFGALTCLDWSPDGRFILTGGEDDLCTIYAPHEQRLIARCQGHSSYVTGVAWDPWRSDERTMRFGSVGEDCKLILWDLSSAALSRPKTHVPSIRRHSIGSTLSLPRRRAESNSHLPPSPTYHPPPRRAEVSMLEPILSKVLSNDLFAGLQWKGDGLVTSSRNGQIKLWDRPPVSEGGGGEGLGGMFSGSIVRIDARAR